MTPELVFFFGLGSGGKGGRVSVSKVLGGGGVGVKIKKNFR